ncbi:MAG: FHA domain-containing protein [Marinilabiliales bacterium]|nr:FHA domain-containing protein [Marinilabiliales bacterium]
MKIIINLRKISDEKYNKEFKFTEFPVRIGRETENEIILEDAKKIVSRSHAIIQNNRGGFQLIDLGSANFTYLNGEKLFPNVDNNLKNGDLIKIGNYELNIIIEQFKTTPAFDEQKTMVFSSPFDDAVTRIFEGINKLSEKYYTDNSPLKSEMLRVSLMQNIEKLIPDESISCLIRIFCE